MLECQLLRRPHRASRENGKRTYELHRKSEKQVLLLEPGRGPVDTAYCGRASEAIENTRCEVNKYMLVARQTHITHWYIRGTAIEDEREDWQ